MTMPLIHFLCASFALSLVSLSALVYTFFSNYFIYFFPGYKLMIWIYMMGLMTQIMKVMIQMVKTFSF